MIHIQGDGGHAKVVRHVLAQMDNQPKDLEKWAIVAVGDNSNRKSEVERLEKNHRFWTAIHPRAIVPHGCISEGSVVMANVVVQPGARVGRHVILNTACTVDHDCVIEDYAHIAPGVHLCGGVHVGEGALVGVGSCAVPGAKIPAWSLVKAGSVVK